MRKLTLTIIIAALLALASLTPAFASHQWDGSPVSHVVTP